MRNRFLRTGREVDLEEAIRLNQQSVAATPTDSLELPGYLNNLGNVLFDRYDRTGREADLKEAIRAYRQSVEATVSDSLDLQCRSAAVSRRVPHAIRTN